MPILFSNNALFTKSESVLGWPTWPDFAIPSQSILISQNWAIIGDERSGRGTIALNDASKDNVDIDLRTNESKIEVAFVIVGSLALFVSMLIAMSHLFGPPDGYHKTSQQTDGIKEKLKQDCCVSSDRLFNIFILTFFCFFYFWCAGLENTFVTWLFNYAVKSNLTFNKQDAAMLDFSSKFSFLIGRILATGIAVKLPVQIMIFGEVRKEKSKLYNHFLFT